MTGKEKLFDRKTRECSPDQALMPYQSYSRFIVVTDDELTIKLTHPTQMQEVQRRQDDIIQASSQCVYRAGCTDGRQDRIARRRRSNGELSSRTTSSS